MPELLDHTGDIHIPSNHLMDGGHSAVQRSANVFNSVPDTILNSTGQSLQPQLHPSLVQGIKTANPGIFRGSQSLHHQANDSSDINPAMPIYPNLHDVNTNIQRPTYQEIHDVNSASLARSQKRKHIPKACLPCYTAKTGCNGERPCNRCINLNREHLCVDRRVGDRRLIKRPKKNGQDNTKTVSAKKELTVPKDPPINQNLVNVHPFEASRIPQCAASHIPTVVIVHQPDGSSRIHVNDTFSALFCLRLVDIVKSVRELGWSYIDTFFAPNHSSYLRSAVEQIMQGAPVKTGITMCKNKVNYHKSRSK